MDPRVDAGAWASTREREGWDIVSASDHYFLSIGGKNQWFPHLWVTVSQMAAATSTVQITSTFANNLFRSPVEFVQASFSMQLASGNRWQAGLGAGWSRAELDAVGVGLPAPRERAERYIEAVHIARSFFDDGFCTFSGKYYEVDVPDMEGFREVPPPPLIGSVGGRLTIAGAAPCLDRVELKASSGATRGGKNDQTMFAAIPRSHLLELIDKVRRVNEHAELTFYARCGTLEDPFSRHLAEVVSDPDSLYCGLFGEPEAVADRLREFERIGISHVDVSPTHVGAFEELAPYLFA
jgi:alkanesulfonate monooxygenase SsuD/methylene tetrahydromethanopterin reductase-like flavin-dependent oxidoreductase (luciferase family)